MPEPTLLAFGDHGGVGEPLATDGEAAEATLAEFAAAGVDTDALAARLQEEGKQSFDESWADLLKSIESERERLGAAG